MKRLVLSLGLMVASLSALAYTPESEVGKIRFADQIDRWTIIDDHRMVFSVGRKANYLVTFGSPCHGLRFAFNVGVSSSNNTVYAGFDRVIADGMSCRIETISRVEQPRRQS